MAIMALRLRRAVTLARELSTYSYFSLSSSPAALKNSPATLNSTGHSHLCGFNHQSFLASRWTISRCRVSKSGSVYSPLDSNNSGERPTLFPGCDYNHWLVTMEWPDPQPSREEKIDCFVKTLANVVGSEEEAKKRIYALSTSTYQGFMCEISEELSEKIKKEPGVEWVLPDSYADPINKTYGVGDKYINGVIIPDTKIYNNRSTGRDRPRNRRRDSMPVERRDVQINRNPLPPVGLKDTTEMSMKGDGQYQSSAVDGGSPLTSNQQDHELPPVSGRGQDYRTPQMDRKGVDYRMPPLDGRGQDYRPSPMDGRGQDYRSPPIDGRGQDYRSLPMEGTGQGYMSMPMNGRGQDYRSPPIEGRGQDYYRPTQMEGQGDYYRSSSVEGRGQDYYSPQPRDVRGPDYSRPPPDYSRPPPMDGTGQDYRPPPMDGRWQDYRQPPMDGRGQDYRPPTMDGRGQDYRPLPVDGRGQDYRPLPMDGRGQDYRPTPMDGRWQDYRSPQMDGGRVQGYFNQPPVASGQGQDYYRPPPMDGGSGQMYRPSALAGRGQDYRPSMNRRDPVPSGDWQGYRPSIDGRGPSMQGEQQGNMSPVDNRGPTLGERGDFVLPREAIQGQQSNLRGPQGSTTGQTNEVEPFPWPIEGTN